MEASYTQTARDGSPLTGSWKSSAEAFPPRAILHFRMSLAPARSCLSLMVDRCNAPVRHVVMGADGHRSACWSVSVVVVLVEVDVVDGRVAVLLVAGTVEEVVGIVLELVVADVDVELDDVVLVEDVEEVEVEEDVLVGTVVLVDVDGDALLVVELLDEVVEDEVLVEGAEELEVEDVVLVEEDVLVGTVVLVDVDVELDEDELLVVELLDVDVVVVKSHPISLIRSRASDGSPRAVVYDGSISSSGEQSVSKWDTDEPDCSIDGAYIWTCPLAA